MSIAAVVDALVAAGATAEMIAAAVRAHCEQEDFAKAEKRARDAERQRKSRMSRDVTVTPCDSCDTPLPEVSEGFPEPLPNLPNPPPKKTPKGVQKAPLDCSESLIVLGCPESLVSDWKAVRKAKNAGPISQPVVDRLKREAAKAGVSVVRAVTICVERGWQGFDADWIAKPGARAGPFHDPPRRGSAGMFDALQEIRREMEDGSRPNDFGQFGSPVLRISSG
jgi:hypothetical protein